MQKLWPFRQTHLLKRKANMAKKEVQEEVVEVVEVNHVTENLTVDPNDPRVVNPTVDGNSQPVVDINEPQ